MRPAKVVALMVTAGAVMAGGLLSGCRSQNRVCGPAGLLVPSAAGFLRCQHGAGLCGQRKSGPAVALRITAAAQRRFPCGGRPQ